jgi:uroporphyrinogen decarboxylase
MSSRQRVLAALRRQEPDRVPIAFDSPECSIHKHAHRSLLEHLGLEPAEEVIIDRTLQAVRPDPRIKRLFRTDTHCVVLAEAPITPDSTEDAYIDEWGIRFRGGGEWYNVVDSPLKNGTVGELRAHPFPDPRQGNRAAGLAEEARKAAEDGFFVHAGGPWGIFEISSSLRGPENLYADMVLNPKYVKELAERVLEHHLAHYEVLLRAVGEFVDAIAVSDDLGGQHRLLFSPALFRQIYKPRLRQLVEHIKRLRPGILVYMHSDGAIFDIIPDLIEIGIDALNPVQFTASGMGALRLKQAFGRDLAFWGGGSDNVVLSQGSPGEVANQVRNQILALGPGGGYVFASVHNISAEVPPENIVALFEAAHRYGSYPLAE